MIIFCNVMMLSAEAKGVIWSANSLTRKESCLHREMLPAVISENYQEYYYQGNYMAQPYEVEQDDNNA